MTAVLVAHDGTTWLPRVIEALLSQSRPVQRVVAVDTGSRDRSGSVLADQLGPSVVFGMDRDTGYAAAVTRALAHPAASVSVPGAPGGPAGARTEWIWLLHDDCEPAPDALEQLLRGAAETPSAAVLGPKIRDWTDHGVILEAGVTIDTVGRRITGIEPREVDQGQDDGDRDVLAVGSPGMLVRRDAWDAVGGFDPGMSLFMEDVDFCWRAHASGYRVRVITEAVVYHAQAAVRRRRPVSVGRRTRLLERRSALVTLLGNLPAGPMLRALTGNVVVSALRTLFFLVAKRPSAALDETAAIGSVLGHPLRLMRARRLRAPGRRAAYGRLRADLPPGRSVRRVFEFLAVAMSQSAQADTVGSHHASDDPDADDFLLTDTGLAQRIVTSPAVLLFTALTVVALVAERSLLGGGGPLGGGALVPSWGGASDLWHTYLQGFHPVGVGSASSAPGYIAVVAVLATVLGGKPWLAVDVILLGCVPLAGMTAYLAARRVSRLPAVRVWAAASYALLPIAMGVVAGGRLGAAAVFILLPVLALLTGRIFTGPPRRARRAAWASGLVLAVGAAFVPLLWLMAVLGAVLAAVALRRVRLLINLAIVVVVPLVLLLPWTVQLAASPGTLLLGTGLHPAWLNTPGPAARGLLLLSPGGPGGPAFWAAAGLVAVAVAALFARQRRALIMTGWAVALGGFAVAIAVSRMRVSPPGGGPAVTSWPGVPLLVAALGLLLAGCAAADALPGLVRSGRTGLRRVVGLGSGAVLAASLVACSAPLLAGAFWLMNGASGPVKPVTGQVVPELVAVSSGSGLQPRTLVLRSVGGRITYAVLRGPSPSLGDEDLTPSPAAQRALNTAVATLVAPGGGDAADQGQLLAQLDIGFVLMRAPVNAGLAQQLAGVAGLRPVSTTPAFELWRLDSPAARVTVAEPGGKLVTIRSGPVGVPAAAAPSAGGTLMLAEPAGGWTATLNGRPLTPVPSPAGRWAQAFRLPSGGGTLVISRDELGHTLTIALVALAFGVVAGLGLPGVRTEANDQPAQAAAAVPGGRPGGRASRRDGTSHRDRAGQRDREMAGIGAPAAGQLDAARAAEYAENGAAAPAAAGASAAAAGAVPAGAVPADGVPAGAVAGGPEINGGAAGRPGGRTSHGPGSGRGRAGSGLRGGLGRRLGGGQRGRKAPAGRRGPAQDQPAGSGQPAVGYPGPAPYGPPGVPGQAAVHADPASGGQADYGDPAGYGDAAGYDPRSRYAEPAPYRESASYPGPMPHGPMPHGAPPQASGRDSPAPAQPSAWPDQRAPGGWPAEAEPAGWPAADRTGGWPEPDGPQSWPERDGPQSWQQPAGAQGSPGTGPDAAWPPPDAGQGWPSGELAPLPQGGPGAAAQRPSARPRTGGGPRSAAGQMPPPRWPAPDYDEDDGQ
ncbi:MAG: glycosyltransferase [Streptosporangiaceae bacterium]